MTENITACGTPAYDEAASPVTTTELPVTCETNADGSEVICRATEYTQAGGAKKLVRTTTTTTITRQTLRPEELLQTRQKPQRAARVFYATNPAVSFLETEDEMPLLDLPAEAGTVRVMGSFLAKLSMCANTPVMEYYSAVKSILLGDHRVKVRNNWQFENFFYGRDQVAKLAIHGGKLVLCLALRPEEYNPEVYHFRDVSGKKKYEYVPMLLELDGDTALREAVKLICEVLWKMGLVPGTPDTEMYQVAAKSWENLYREGQVEFLREWQDGTSQILIGDKAVNEAFFAQAASLPTLTFAPVSRAEETLTLALPEMPDYYKQTTGESGIRAEAEAETKTVREVTEEIIDLAGPAGSTVCVPAEPEIRYIEVPAEPEIRYIEVPVPVVAEETEEEAETAAPKVRFSYLARLIAAPGMTKDYYSTIKNEVFSYYDVEGTVGMDGETFTLYNEPILSLAMRGKAVLVYFALDPAEYRDHPTYILDDVSHVQRYAKTPVLLRVDTERTLRCALELVAILMESVGTRRGKRPETDYRIPYEKRDALIERGIVTDDGTAISSDVLRAAIAELMPNPAPFLPEEAPPPAPEKPAKAKKPKKEVPQQEEEDPDSEILTDAEGHAYRIHYRRSFTARLSHATDAIREQYNALKARLLSFDGMRSDITWDGERYTLRGETVAYMLIKSKALYLYLAMDTEVYKYSAYHFNDVSGQKARHDTPMEIRVRSDWSLRQTLKLLEEEFAKDHEVTAGAVEDVAYCPAYRTTEDLVADGLIKTRTVALDD